MELVRLIKTCSKETCSTAGAGKYSPHAVPIEYSLKQDVLSLLLFNFALEHFMKKVRENQVGLKLNGTYQIQIYVDDVNLF
jgi:hypothetical protein